MNIKQDTIDISVKVAAPTCSQCSLSQLCLPMGLDKQELIELDHLIQRTRPLKEDQFLVRQNAPFSAIFAVRSGMLKSYAVDQQGNEHIHGFHLPGELVGLDAIYDQRYRCNIVALDTASVCTVPYQGLTDLAERIPSLQNQLLRLLSKEINDLGSLNHDSNVEQRLAAFIWNLSARFEQRGYSSQQFLLSMSRQDIANHLNMAPETISRLLKRFQSMGVIQLDRREMIILKMDKLKKLAGCSPDL